MALKVLMRGGIYLLFILGVVLKWLMSKMDKSKNRTDADKADSDQPLSVVIDDPIAHHSNQDWHVRLSAMRMLAESPGVENIELLIEHLDDDVFDVREAAALALIKHGEEAVTRSINVLLSASLEAREMAVTVLAAIPTELSIAALVRALLEDESAWVRIPAAGALGNIGDKIAVQTLIRALDDAHYDVYSAVVVALNQIGTLEALQAIADHPYNDKTKKRRSLPDDDLLQFS